MRILYLSLIAVLLLSFACSKTTATDQVADPVITPAGGIYIQEQSISITCATPDAEIYYTIDGSNPTDSSQLYNGAFGVDLDTTVKAIAQKNGMKSSNVVSATYSPLPADIAFVEGGSFALDSRIVSVSSFLIGKYEVSQAEFESVMGSNPSYFEGNPSHPVDQVSWFDAIEYCNRLSISEDLEACYSYAGYGNNPNNWPEDWDISPANHTSIICNFEAKGYRLPTEMEWIYAAKGGNLGPATNFNRYAGTNLDEELGQYAWYWQNNNPSGTKPIGTKLPNELEIYDMSGNVYEYVWDIYAEYPPDFGPDYQGPSEGTDRIQKGGTWIFNANECLILHREHKNATWNGYQNGFRIAKSI